MKSSAGVRCRSATRWGRRSRRPSKSHSTYLELLREVGCEQPGTPYNLLATRDWTMIVPRTQECFGPISLNSLAFAGSLLVKNREQLRARALRGPHVRAPRSDGLPAEVSGAQSSDGVRRTTE